MNLRLAATILMALGVLAFTTKFKDTPPSNESVAELLELFEGEISPNRPNDDIAYVSITRGQDIVTKGYSEASGRKSKTQSKHFSCLACHNIKREDPDLTVVDPDARLYYAADQEIPYLQGSTFYGLVNRTSYYNGDYVKKYGPLVEPTRNNIREAIQLCAVECSQGRRLDDYEVESVLAYLWTLELKLDDLDLSEGERRQLQETYETGRQKKRAIDLLTSKYSKDSPATFTEPLTIARPDFSSYEGRPSVGKLVYELSCQHCHLRNNFSYLLLDSEPLTFRYLAKNLDRYRKHSLAQVVRYGTDPKGGKKAYMPQYTNEKLSDQQLIDLRAYITQEATR